MFTVTREVALNHLYANSEVQENGCREWQASLTKDGYGQLSNRAIENEFSIKGAHRLMFQLVNDFPLTSRAQVVMHSCDNPRCIEPKHLSMGTQRENMQDCVAKGRRINVRGEDHVLAKITEDDVRLIRALEGNGMTVSEVGYLFDMGQSNVSRIRNRQIWKHVE